MNIKVKCKCGEDHNFSDNNIEEIGFENESQWMDEDGAEPEEIDRDEHRFVVHKIYSGTIHSSCGNNIDLEYTILANDSSLEVFGADLLVWDREGFSE